MSKIKHFMEKFSSVMNIVIIKKDNIIVCKIKRLLKVIFIALVTVVGGLAILLLAMALLSNMVIFEYTDNEQCISKYTSSDFDPKAEGYLMKFPHFANPVILENVGSVSIDGGTVAYGIPTGMDENKIYIYHAINAPIRMWVFAISAKYHDRVNIDYTVENDGKTLTVFFSGTAEWEGEKIPIEQKFIFDIENADVDNLPKWLNEDETCEEVKEWNNYILNYNEVPMPSWAEWLLP